MYRKTTFDNGLRVITHRMPGRQSVAVGVWITTGGRYESREKKGISHYLEHMVFKGTKHYSCRQLKESIEGVGGTLNGFTSEELTCYLAKLPSRYLSRGVHILTDMVVNPLLPPADVRREKQVILEELKMYRDQPQSHVYDLLDDLLWPGQPLGEPVIGTVESVTAIDRRALLQFKQQYYSPSNIVVSAAGDLKHDALLSRLKKAFGSLRTYTVNAFMQAQESQSEPRLTVSHKDTEQSHLALGFHAFKRDHPLRHALAMLHILLGGNMSSRLFNELREKRGLAYEIGTGIKRFHDTGAFIVHAGIDNRKVCEALEVILKELYRVGRVLVSPEEFRRTREYYRGQLMLALEDTLEHMLWVGESAAALNRVYTLQEIIREIDRVKRENLREVARMVFSRDKINCALIGPLARQKSCIAGVLRPR